MRTYKTDQDDRDIRSGKPTHVQRRYMDEMSTLDHAGEVFFRAQGLSTPRLLGWMLRSVFGR